MSEALQVPRSVAGDVLDSPRRALACALVLLGASQFLFANPDPVSVAVADAGRHEGQEVEVAGVVRSLQTYDHGVWLTVAEGGYALKVHAKAAEGVHLGTLLHATGRLSRQGPELVLFATHLEAGEPADLPQVPLSMLARMDPSEQLTRVSGTVQDGALRADGVQFQLGEGPWPQSGRVTASVTALFDPSCACLRLHAHAVGPWTD